MTVSLDSVSAGALIFVVLIVPALITVVGTLLTSGAAARAAAASSEMRTIFTTIMVTSNQKLDTLMRSTAAVYSISAETHTLVNSNYGASLMATVTALRSVARLTDDPGARELAEEAVRNAEKQYADHLLHQQSVDAARNDAANSARIAAVAFDPEPTHE